MTLSGNGYVCSEAETFDLVALMVYGDEKYAAELMNANPELCHIAMFSGGEILYLPIVEVVEDDGSGTGFMPTKAPWKE